MAIFSTASTPTTQKLARFQFTLRKTLLLLAVFSVWLGLLRHEWIHAPNVGPLLGPLWFVWYQDAVGGLILAALLTPCLFAFVFKPHAVTAFVSLLAIAFWLFLGELGKGIGC